MATKKAKWSVSKIHNDEGSFKVKQVGDGKIILIEPIEAYDSDGDTAYQCIGAWVDGDDVNTSLWDTERVVTWLNKGTWEIVDFETPMLGNVPRGTTKLESLESGSIWEPTLNFNKQKNGKRKKEIHGS
jgi:hypothetical protein